MTQENHSRVYRLIEIFRSGLSDNVQAEIGEAAFEKLALMINEAILEDRRITANMLEEVVKTLRKDIETPELGL
jgi:hypothetical protein